MEKPIRVGVIGVGTMGRHHARVYSQLKNVHLIGVCDLAEHSASSIAKEYNTKAFTNCMDLFRENLDGVSIAVPTFLHRKVATEAINAGISLLIEKPIADTVKNAEKIVNKAAQKNVKLMVGHIERFNPSVCVLKESFGSTELISIDITRVGPLPGRINDVGVVTDLAVHDIDLVRYLTDSEFKKIHGLTSSNVSKNEDTAIISFEMENGVLAHITTNWVTPFKVREINASTKHKFIRCWLMEQKVVEYSRYNENNSYIVKELTVSVAEPLKIELETFCKCLRNNSAPPITGEDGLKAMEVVNTILHTTS